MFEEKLFQLLTDLRLGKHEVKKEFTFSQPDSTEESESFVDDVLFTFGDDYISCDISWSYYKIKGMGSSDNLTPVDSDIIILDYIDIENFIYTENDKEIQLEDLSKYPRLKKLFLTYVISLMKDDVIDKVDNGVWMYYVKEGISGMYLNLNQDKIDRMRQKVRILHSKYGTGSKEYEDAFDELHNLIMKSDEEKHDFYSGKLPKPKNENIKSFDDFLNEKKKLDIKVKIFKYMANKYREEHGLPPNSKTPYDELMKKYESWEDIDISKMVSRNDLTSYYICRKCKLPSLSFNKILKSCSHCHSNDLMSIDEDMFYTLLKSKIGPELYKKVLKQREDNKIDFMDLTTMGKKIECKLILW